MSSLRIDIYLFVRLSNILKLLAIECVCVTKKRIFYGLNKNTKTYPFCNLTKSNKTINKARQSLFVLFPSFIFINRIN